ncbi:MAG: hypothetical protein ACREPI_01695, partial [Candidatus Dormibacterales bacterium]
GFTPVPSGPDRGYRRFGDGTVITLRLLAPGADPLRAAEQRAVAEDLRAVGIRVLLPAQDPDPAALFGAYQDGGILLSHRFDMAVYGAAYGAPAEPATLDGSYLCGEVPGPADGGAGANDTSVCQGALDRALAEGVGSADPAARIAAYRSAQALLARLLPEVPLYESVTVTAVSDRLRGFRASPFFWTDGAQGWWLEH